MNKGQFPRLDTALPTRLLSSSCIFLVSVSTFASSSLFFSLRSSILFPPWDIGEERRGKAHCFLAFTAIAPSVNKLIIHIRAYSYRATSEEICCLFCCAVSTQVLRNRTRWWRFFVNHCQSRTFDRGGTTTRLAYRASEGYNYLT